MLPETYSALTTVDIAAQVRALGKAFEGYAEKTIENGLDGAFLQNEVTAEDLPDIFNDLGVSSTVHQKKLAALFRSFKASCGGEGTAGAEVSVSGSGGYAESKCEVNSSWSRPFARAGIVAPSPIKLSGW